MPMTHAQAMDQQNKQKGTFAATPQQLSAETVRQGQGPDAGPLCAGRLSENIVIKIIIFLQGIDTPPLHTGSLVLAQRGLPCKWLRPVSLLLRQTERYIKESLGKRQENPVQGILVCHQSLWQVYPTEKCETCWACQC